MKASTLIIIVLICAIGFVLFRPTDAERKRLEEERLALAATPTPRPAPPPPQPMRTPQQTPRYRPPMLAPRSSLVVVRGTVASVSPDGMFIECEQNTSLSHFKPGALDDPKIAQETLDEEKTQWGDLLINLDGTIRKSDWEPTAMATGRLLLRDHPLQFQFNHGDHIKIIAAPLDEVYTLDSMQLRTFTARFTIVAGSPGSAGNWMWQKKQGTLLDH